jgi:hypothetical protein
MLHKKGVHCRLCVFFQHFPLFLAIICIKVKFLTPIFTCQNTPKCTICIRFQKVFPGGGTPGSPFRGSGSGQMMEGGVEVELGAKVSG